MRAGVLCDIIAPMAKESFLKDKVILVTGGTGTFGRAFVARVLKDSTVKKVIIFSRDELKQSEIAAMYPSEPRLRYFIGDIRDPERLRRAFQGVDIVVHAAALKQVPATEYNPFEAVQTNIIGSKNVIDAALDCGVSKTILVSSDKAVEPINLYGATKLSAERLFVAANSYSGTSGDAFSVIRYGNVIGSRGSLVEMVQRNRAKGVITLTDKEMTRFWIRIEQVMEMVLEAIERMQGGEIFVPKMKNMSVSGVIRLIAPECKLKVIGIRPGEKLHETLITSYEVKRTKELKTMYVIAPEFTNGEIAWLKRYPSVARTMSYASNNKKYLLKIKEAQALFTR